MWYLVWFFGMGAILAGCIFGMHWLERQKAFEIDSNADL